MQYATTSSPTSRQALTYFIQGASGGPIKIGTTVNLAERLAHLDCGSPVPLVVLATVEGNVETALHQRLAPHRLRGEWFAPSHDVLAEVASARAGQHTLGHVRQFDRAPKVVPCSRCGVPLAVTARGKIPTRCRWVRGAGYRPCMERAAALRARL